MKEISAGGVVYRLAGDRIEIQLIQDRYGQITLAKGKMEQGETIRQTALREIKEETGLTGRIDRKLEVIHYQYEKDGITVDKEVHYYLVEALEGKHTPQLEEIQSVQWVDPDKAWELQCQQGYDNNDQVLQKALTYLMPSKTSLARFIDHTLLKATADYSQIKQLCDDAKKYGFYSVCVNSVWVETCRRLLEGSKVQISAVCGFPLGAAATEVKVKEAVFCIEKGAAEIDMVMQVGRLLEGQAEAVYQDIKQVVEAVKQVRGDAAVKVILETGYLTEEQIVLGCKLAEKAGADFVKTSTGFGPRGASEQDVEMMQQAISDSVRIKASGGIRDLAAAKRYLRLGADRLGTSSGPAIMEGTFANTSY